MRSTRQKNLGIEIIGLFDDRGDEPLSAANAPASRKLGSVDDLVEFGRRTRVDLVIFSLPISAEGRILQMLKKLWVLPVDIRLAAHSQQAAIPPALLFLHRQRAGARRRSTGRSPIGTS